MKAIRKHTTTTLLAISLLFTLASCVQDDLFNTPHPDRGVVAVSTDFPQEAAGEVVIAVDGEPLDGTESHPLTPGLHTLLAYNLPPGFNVSDGIAYVDAASDPRALAAVIAPLPGYLYSGTQLVEVTADDTVRVGLHVTRRVRDLRIELDVTEGDASRIVFATGTLTGVAGAFDLRAETLTGEPVVTVSDFAHEGGTVAADFRLLGTMGGTQTFTLVLTFTDGYTQTVESDLTDILADFNGGDYTQRFTVTGNLSVPVQGSVGNCTIDGWQVADAGNVDAH